MVSTKQTPIRLNHPVIGGQVPQVVCKGGGRSLLIGAAIVLKMVSVQGQEVTSGITTPEGVSTSLK